LEQAAAPDYDKAFSDAQAFQKAGQLADAQLLYFFGARANHAPSAFELATMNDPNHHSSATSLLPKPDPFQAYKWYSVARDHGMAAASQRLEELHSWAMKAAEEGDAEAERLLLQWKN
jgi:TPR repeat protein